MKSNFKLYCFSKNLPEAFPSQIIVDVTERCNLACVHCAHAQFVKTPAYSGKDMSPEIHTKLVSEVASDGKGFLRYLRYTAMGETLLHPQIHSFLAQAKKESGAAVALTSNGTLLDRDRVARLLETGVDIIDISLDAFSAKSYAAIRKGGNREKTYAGVLELLKQRDQGGYTTKIAVSFIEQPLNKGEGEEFRAFWLENGADQAFLRRLHSHAGALDKIAEDLNKKKLKQLRKPCLYPWERVSLGIHGKLSFCPSDWTGHSAFADFSTTSIAAAWQGEFMQCLRKAHLDNALSNDCLCAGCPDWAQTRWPGEGRRYADMVADFTGQGK